MICFTRKKKGSFQDLGFLLAFALFFAIVTLISFKIVTSIDDEAQSSSVVTDDGKAAVSTLKNVFTGTIDKGFLILFIGIALGSLALAAMVRISPIFIPFYLLALSVMIFMGGVMSNIYQEMAATAQLASEANQLIVITNIMTYLPMIIGVIGIILMIVMYKNWRADQIQ